MSVNTLLAGTVQLQPDLIRKSDDNVWTILRFSTLSSTNGFIHHHHHSLDDFTAVWALTQTKGRGRQRRVWRSIPNTDLTFSTIVPLLAQAPEYWPSVTLLVAVAVVEQLKELGFSPQIKWPNDIVINERKVAGILCESLMSNRNPRVIIGIGLNVNSPAESFTGLRSRATSLMVQGGSELALQDLLLNVLAQLHAGLKMWHQNRFKSIRHRVEEFLLRPEGRIQIRQSGQIVTGQMVGIDEFGYLMLKRSNGALERFTTGEMQLPKKQYR